MPRKKPQEDDGEAGLYTQGAPPPFMTQWEGEFDTVNEPIRVELQAQSLTLHGASETERQRLLDDVAAKLFVAGWPHSDTYKRAEAFIRIRDAYIATRKGKP
jgi:hypothetical protein